MLAAPYHPATDNDLPATEAENLEIAQSGYRRGCKRCFHCFGVCG